MNKLYRADLHIHSRYSNKPSIWALRKFNCPESYTAPKFIYETAKKNGMDYVTITDHNSINGALEIAHLQGAFISVEITTYFPEDGCKVHVVALDITEKIYNDIMSLRKNIYELVSYLKKISIIYFIAHPLYDMDSRLKADNIEKMLMLFDVVEVRNGARASRYNRLIEGILSSLTKEKIELLANKHNIEPHGSLPWKKAIVGGSDDHSGFFVGRVHTVSLNGETLKDFLCSIIKHETRAEGDDGDPLTLAHSIYGIAYRFYLERLNIKTGSSLPFVKTLLSRFFDVRAEESSLFEKVKFFIRKNLPEIYTRHDSRTFEEILEIEAKRLLNNNNFMESINTETKNRKIFAVTSYLANRMIYIYTDRLTRTSLDITNLFQSLSTIGLVHLLVTPYYLAFHHQHRSKQLINELDKRFLLMDDLEKPQKIALFTDTLHEINGVAITIKRLIETARTRGIELVVITSSSEETSFENGIMNFKSIGDFTLPEYPELKLHFPPILDVIDYFEKEGFTRIHASTPGTLGLLALFISKLVDIPISGTYHTDIPQYVKSLTNDSFLEEVAWIYMIWFYNQMEEVMVPSSSTQRQLIEKGLIAEKTKPLPRWVDTEIFTPVKRDADIWKEYGLDGGVKFLYVGRVSKEKNLELLTHAFIDIAKAGFHANLVIVGDGPYRAEMEDRLKGLPVLFTGFLSGEGLYRIYASSDIFTFPSATDTFGNVVLEAQASGLPVIVSDEGGPKELMIDGETGIVIKADNKETLVNAMTSFLKDKSRISLMGEKARAFVETKKINDSESYSTILNYKLEAINYKQEALSESRW